MFVDQTSLLLALGFAAFALSATLLVTWLASRTEKFIIVWATGAGVLAFGFAGFSVYAVTSIYILLWISNLLLSGAFVIFFSAACLFTEQSLPRQRVAAVAISIIAAITLPFLFGLDALGAMIGNIVNAILLAATAWKFWEGRSEAPTWVTGISALYTISALSFIPCAVMIYLKGPLVLTAPPSGWAEDVNSIVGLIALTGIGAMSLAVNQARLARLHQAQANTDVLTGLLNRRAIFEAFERGRLPRGTAALLFDLDHFKSVNDRHGHAAGDEALRRFAQVMRKHQPRGSFAVRMGGEEFLLVIAEGGSDQAMQVAELIRSGFAHEILQGAKGGFRCTVSVGLALAEDPLESFDDILRRADDALYTAKNAGRNRIWPALAQ